MLLDSMGRTGGGVGEIALIEEIRRSFAGVGRRGVTLGIGDDCAVLRPRQGCEVLVTTDLTLEGRHFRRDLHAPQSVGHRCLARGLSDLAAMGAEPTAAFLSLALPGEMLAGRSGLRWVRGFLAGLRDLAHVSGVQLAGGDTAQAPDASVIADIILVGTAPAGTALRRSGARAGDALYVTGALGGAAAELRSMLSGEARIHKPAAAKHASAGQARSGAHPQTFPEPRLAVGIALRRRALASACIDLSDGLSTDLNHLCQASGVGARVEMERLPMHALARQMEPGEADKAVLHGGEDYELLFSARRGVRIPRRIAGVAVSRIGDVVVRKGNDPAIALVAADGSEAGLLPGGWEHFVRDGATSADLARSS